eukprot:Seg1919.5 transcript_id=Seg1919.5/GoldUCD/mRNA.D3Y31 product=Fucolectin-4 protein_id=Seg1919.5/GoldUCD/D3Y31
MISISSVVALLPLMVSFATGASFYHLLNAEEDIERGSTIGALFNKTFYECDREESCTHVAKLIEKNSFVMVYGEDEMKKLPKNAFIWVKVKQVRKAAKVASKDLRDIAVNKATHQSSLSRGRQSSLANDGDSSTCSLTMTSATSFLTVDLGKVALVSSVAVMAENPYGVDKFDIVIGNTDGVGNPPCVSDTSVSQRKIDSFTCPSPMRGRYVTVIQKFDGFASLSLCEFQVFGTFEE